MGVALLKPAHDPSSDLSPNCYPFSHNHGIKRKMTRNASGKDHIGDTPIFHWTMIMGRNGKFIQVSPGFQWRCRNEKNIGVRIPLIIIHIQTMEEKLAKSISRNMCLPFVGFDLSELGKHGKCRDSINVSCLILEPIISIALLLFILLVWFEICKVFLCFICFNSFPV